MSRKIVCDMIEIKGSLTRHEIVKKIVNIFINTEYNVEAQLSLLEEGGKYLTS